MMRSLFHHVVLAMLFLGVCSGRADEFRINPQASDQAVKALDAWLHEPREGRPMISEQNFASVPLTKPDAAHARQILWEDHVAFIQQSRAKEMAEMTVEIGSLRMKFQTAEFGSRDNLPKGGRSLFISLHGGGNAPPAVNESQWRNQVQLAQAYRPAEGIYLAPRAPTDTWDLWHQPHVDGFFDRLIENCIVLEKVNPNRVYLLGYSAGGDGVYQLAPRMADRWAAAAMMGGHPNDASPLGLRNIGFAIQVGANDAAYQRNQVAQDWSKRLDELQQADTAGYPHFTELHAGKGHWMDLEDKKAIPWMEKFTRNSLPDKIVWHQDDVTHPSFYWLAEPEPHVGNEIVAERKEQTIALSAKGANAVIVRLNDALLDLDQPVTITWDGTPVFQGQATRTIGALASTLGERGDPELVFSASVKAEHPKRP